MMDAKFEELANKIREYGEKQYPNGYDVYADYHDEFDGDTVNDILNSNNPKEEFYDLVREIYLDMESDIENEVFTDVQDGLNLSTDDRDYMDDNFFDFMEVIKEAIPVNLPYDDFLSQKICADIVIDNGDAETDFSMHTCYPHYDAAFHDGLSKESGMMYVANCMGYKNKRFKKIFHEYKVARLYGRKEKCNMLKKKYPFITSCYHEIMEQTSSMGAFVICVEVTLKDLLDWHEQKKDITVPKVVFAGLYDFWNGAGSQFEIKMEKDIIISKDKIKWFLPDEAWGTSKHAIYGGYGLKECYGFIETVWKKISI